MRLLFLASSFAFNCLLLSVESSKKSTTSGNFRRKKDSGGRSVYEDAYNDYSLDHETNKNNQSRRSLQDSYSLEQVGSNMEGVEAEGLLGTNVSLSGNGRIVAFGIHQSSANGIESGTIRVMEYNGSIWSQVGSDVNGRRTYNYFGKAISLSSDGRIVAAGGMGTTASTGEVRVLKYESKFNDWVQYGNILEGPSNGSRFGIAVVLSGDGTTLAIAARSFITI